MTKPDFSDHFDSVLRYMDDKLYSSGKAIANHLGSAHGFGTKVARQMVERGLLVWLPDVEAWRISRAGRDQLQSYRGNP